MSLYTFFGCLFVAYGPILSIFFLYIGRHARHVLMTVASAFACLIALFISSVIWYFAKAAQAQHHVAITYSILIQELFRGLYYLLLQRVAKGLSHVPMESTAAPNSTLTAFVTGYGFALTSALVSYITLLVESIGPGVIMCPSCPQATLYFISAVTTSLFSLNHMAWMMIAFRGFADIRKPKGVARVAWVVLSHFGASFASTLNSSTTVRYGCVYSIVTSIGILLVSTTLIVMSLKSQYKIRARE